VCIGSYTTRNLANTKRITDEIFPLVFYDEFYRYNFLSLYPLVSTNRNISLIYIEGIALEKEGRKNTEKYDDV
jgi:hypothetical protein